MTKLIIFLLGMIYSCTPKSNKSQLDSRAKITLDFSDQKTHSLISSLNFSGGGSRWSLSDPSTISQINCYGILINDGGVSSTCKNISGQEIARGNIVEGTVPDNGSIQLELASNKDIEIQVIGFVSSSSCPNFRNLSASNYSTLSAPLLIGKQKASILPGDNNINIQVSLNQAQEFDDCTGGDFTWANYDSTASVLDVTSSTSDGTKGIGNAINLNLTFSKAVSVTGTPVLTLETGSTDRQATYLSGSSSTTLTFQYTVQSNDISNDLEYVNTSSLLLSGGTIKDSDGINSGLSLPAIGSGKSISDHKNLVIDGVIPTVHDVSSSNSDTTYIQGNTINLIVTYNEAVYVSSGTPTIKVNESSTLSTHVPYLSGSGSVSHSFSFTVSNGASTSDLEYFSTSSLISNGASIADLAGNTASLSLPISSGSGGFSLGDQKNIALFTNNSPVAANSTFSTYISTTLSANVSATDSDGQALTYSLLTSSGDTSGTFNFTNSSKPNFTFTPSGTISGSMSISYTATDSYGASSTGDIKIWEANEFGSGKDGSISISTDISHSNLNTSLLGSGKVLMASRNLGSATYTNSSPASISISIPSFTQDVEFSVGDEIMWTVIQSASNSNCNSGYEQGRYGFTHITGMVPPNTLYLNRYLLSNAPNNIRLSDGTCRIQITRVPNIENLSVVSGANLIGVSKYSNSTSEGGIFAMRVFNNFNLTNTFNISASYVGFSGENGSGFQGNGVSGNGIQSVSGVINGGGGGSSTAVGGSGGGGVMSQGGSGTSASTGNRGNYLTCSYGDCVAFGGAGGSGYYTSPQNTFGGTGGGIIFLNINK